MDAIYLDFVNSEFREFRGRWVHDELEQPGWMEAFLLTWGLEVESMPDARIRRALITLRSLLSRGIETLIEEGQISEQDQIALNTVLLKVPLCRHLRKERQGYQVNMVPVKRDWVGYRLRLSLHSWIFLHLTILGDSRGVPILTAVGSSMTRAKVEPNSIVPLKSVPT